MTQKGDSHSLFIRNVQDDDAGDYRVEAANAKSEAKLICDIRKLGYFGVIFLLLGSWE